MQSEQEPHRDMERNSWYLGYGPLDLDGRERKREREKKRGQRLPEEDEKLAREDEE